MTSLTLLFPGDTTFTILQLPKEPINIVKAFKHEKLAFLLSEHGTIYCVGFPFVNKGIGVQQWDDEDTIPYLHAIRHFCGLPAGCSITKARQNAKLRQKKAEHENRVSRLRSLCKTLGVKSPL